MAGRGHLAGHVRGRPPHRQHVRSAAHGRPLRGLHGASGTVPGAVGGFLHLPLDAEPDNTRIHDTGGNWSSFVPYVGKEQLEGYIRRLDGPGRAEAEDFVRHARAYWNDEKPREDTRWRRSLKAGEANAVLSTPGLTDVAGILGYNIAEVVHAAVQGAPARPRKPMPATEQ